MKNVKKMSTQSNQAVVYTYGKYISMRFHTKNDMNQRDFNSRDISCNVFSYFKRLMKL